MIEPQEFWSEVLRLKYKKDIQKGNLLGILFSDNVYYTKNEMKELMGQDNETMILSHKIKKIFDGMIEALDQIMG